MKKNYFNLRLRSQWLLIALLALLTGASPAWADGKALPYSYGFEDYNLATDGWTKYFGTSLTKNNNECAIVGAAKKTGTYGFRFSSNNTSGENAQYLISPELNAPNGVIITFEYKVSSGTYAESFKVGYSTTDTDVASFTWDEGTTTNNTSWQTFEKNFPAGTKYVAIYYYSNWKSRLFVDDFNFTAPISGPVLAVADGSTKISNGYSYNFGPVNSGTTHYFLLSNPGTEDLGVSVSETGNFGATLSTTTIPAGNSANVTLTVTMPATTGNSVITITPASGSGIDPFVINVNGTVKDPSKLFEDFSGNALPSGWTKTDYSSSYKWTFTGGYAQYNGWNASSAGTLTLPQLSFTAGEKFFFKAMNYVSSSSTAPAIKVQTSTNGEDFTDLASYNYTDLKYNEYTLFTVTIPSADIKYIRFANCIYVRIDDIYGGEVASVPIMSVTQPASLDFGLYDKDASPAPTKTFTIANTGSATLSGINVTSANAAFTITNAPTSLAAGASQNVTITMSTATIGALSSLITVSATDMTDATFTVTGTVKPAGMAVEEFTDGLPANWTNASWTFAGGQATGKSSSAYLTTPKLTFTAGDFIIIKAKRYDSDTSDYLTVQGSSDNGSTWTAYSKKLQNADGLSYPDYGTMVLNDIPTTVNKLRFVGYYAVVDEIYGLTYAPVLSVTKEAAAVSTPADYDFGETTANASVTYNFANADAGTINITNVAITGAGAAAYSTNWTASVAAPFDLTITRTYDSSRGGAAQDAVVTVTTSEGNFVINVTGTDKGANDPEFAVFIGEDEQTTGANLGFGTITANSVKTFKIKNNGTGALNVTAVTMPDADYTTDLESAPSVLSPLVIAAGSSKTINVTLAASAKAIKSSKNITISAEGFADFTFVADANVMPGAETIDFATAIPDTWDNESNGWSIQSGAAKCTGKKNLTSPKLTFTDDDFFVFKVKASDSGSGDYVTLEGSTDNGETWTGFEKITYSYPTNFGANTGDYSTIVVSGISSSINKIRFNGYYVLLDDIMGLTRDANDPVIAVKDAVNAAVTSGTTKDFGWAQTAQSTTYKISNSGTGTLTISDITAPEGFTAATAGNVMTVAAGADPLVLTVTMTNAVIGAKSGTITLTTDGGNFEIPVKGFIYGDRNLVDFTDATQYTGWTGVTVTDNVASLGSTAIETTPFAATAAEKLYVEIKGSSSYGSKSFSYSYSRDGGANWSAATALVASTYSNVADQVFTITDIADGEAASTVLIRFTGAMLGINRIYGFEALTAPVMTLDKTADYNFGMQTANAEYVITVTNTGTATLNNLAATLTTGTNYSVAITKPDGESTTTITAGKATVPAGQQAIITVTQLFDANNGLASLSDVLTISADDVASQVINLSGQTRDASKWYVDFASANPDGIISKDGWTISTYNGYASVTTESALVSQTLTLAANEKVQFDAKKMSYGTISLKVRHSLNGGLSWSEYTDLTGTEGFNSSAFKTMQYSVGNTDASTVAMIEFLGANVYLDNIYGGTLNNEVPMIQVKKSSTVVASGVNEAFGSIHAETTANYTIKNIGGGTLTITSPITTVTGVATAAVDATSLGNNESATLTITMPIEAPYGEKSGAVTVKTSLGDFVINYTATTMDPNALNVDFSDNTLPTGWYKESGWNNYDQVIYRSDRSSDKEFMTQKLNVAGTSDVLKFDAKKYGSTYASSTVLKVSYSTDRVNWTEIGNYASEMTTSWKTFEISGLAAGEYYLKFTGRYASIDNIIGWTKVTGIDHDLYVTATSFPATTDLGDDATITATVTSLRANETGVYAKLFIDGAEEATSAAKAINLNATQTFSFEYAIPENKTAQIKVYFSDDTEAFVTAENDMKVSYTLDETIDPSTITAGTYNITLNHSFVAGWNTVCLPFDFALSNLGANAKALEFTAYESSTKTLTFSPVTTTLSAGKPYVVYVESAISTPFALNETAITATTVSDVTFGDVTFHGTYAQMAAGSLDGKWGLTAAGKIAKAGASTTMKGFRGYFSGVPAGARVVFFGEDELTGIRTISVDNSVEGAYNLKGQKVEKMLKGNLYIINGKKTVVR